MTTRAPQTARTTARRRRGSALPAGRRGVALILVLTVIAILTSIGVDFSYSSRVSLKLAENQRDGLRAYYLARSAVNLTRLLLHFQKQLDTVGGQAGAALQRVLSSAQGTTPAGQTATATASQQAAQPVVPGQAAPSSLGIRLWELVPIDSNAFGLLLGGGIPDGVDPRSLGADRDRSETQPTPAARPRDLEPPKEPLHAFGGFEGSYHAKVVDENSRINVVKLNGLGADALAALIQMRAMMADPKYDFIFNEEDAQHDRVPRDDVIIALKDWIDEDETGSGIDPTQTRGSPFVNAYSDENGAYQRYTPRYKAKNARPDSLEELYMVRGVNDRFMAAFGDRMTIWPDINAKLNVNTNDPLQQVTNILIAADNPNDPRLRDPALLRTILQEIQVRKLFSFFGLTATDFVGVLTANGIKVRPELLAANSPNNFLGDQSDTFRITATGKVGHIERTITAVVRYDDLLGRLLYWKEL
jgi:general secretion pathway protein K